jgi:puromycin-sensitive aminopeptidase
LGWDPDPGEDELTRQLRGDLVRALGILGNDLEVQQAARRRAEHPDGLDANVSAAVIGILAHAGDAAQFEEYVGRYRTASTPQEERRYLYSLTAFRVPELLMRALQMAVGGEIRTQDAPFIVRLALGNVYGRDLAWDFVKQQWDHMVRQYPKNGLRRLLEGISSLATPSLEEDVRRFVADRKIDLGGKTLEQYLEQLRIAVSFRERMLPTLDRYLARFA